jgi:hypothetical protein
LRGVGRRELMVDALFLKKNLFLRIPAKEHPSEVRIVIHNS